MAHTVIAPRSLEQLLDIGMIALLLAYHDSDCKVMKRERWCRSEILVARSRGGRGNNGVCKSFKVLGSAGR